MESLGVHLGLAAIAFLAATILPGSSEPALAALLLRHPNDALSLWAAATLGNVAGAAVNWLLGGSLMRFSGRPWFPVSPTWIDRASRWFGRYGTWLLLFSWVPVVGDPLTVAAGLLRVRFGLFLLLVAIGKAARYAVIVGGVEAARSWFW